jgi:hypothetical protein
MAATILTFPQSRISEESRNLSRSTKTRSKFRPLRDRAYGLYGTPTTAAFWVCGKGIKCINHSQRGIHEDLDEAEQCCGMKRSGMVD